MSESTVMPSMPPQSATLLTGATGFIGAEILRRLLEEPDRRVWALVRAGDQRAAERRGLEVLFRIFLHDRDAYTAARRRMRWVAGDLARPDLGLSPAAREEIRSECGEVIHAGASTAWELSAEDAAVVNYRAVVSLSDLVAEMARGGRSVRLVHFSTAYVVGRREGHILPEDLPEEAAPFNNTYEQTKARAERYLRERMGEIPVTVLRPSIVVGDSRTGRTFNFNVLYFPIKLLYRGLLPLVPGRATTRLDIVPVDYVCDATLALGRDSRSVGRTYNLTADDDAMPLTVFGTLITDFFNERLRAEGRSIRPPRVIGPVSWAVVRWWLSRRLKGRPRQQFQTFNIYLPYILTHKRFDAASTRSTLGQSVAYPAIESYILRVAEYALTREWGHDVSWDPAMLPDRDAP
jgi:thioester reductase-like protein